MTNRLPIFLLLCLISNIPLIAQDLYYKNYNWENAPNHQVDAADQELDMLSLKEHRVNEFAFDEDDNFVQYRLIHKILWLNSDDRIEQYNKIYLPYNNSSNLLESHARVISPSGVIQELDKSKILTAEDETSKQTIKYFALEGIEKGGFIEYWYVIKGAPSYQGERIALQDDYKKLNTSFQVFAPDFLVFEFKSYNGLADAVVDESIENKLSWLVKEDTIEALFEEELSAYDAKKKLVIYKLDKNKNTGVSGITSYNNVVKNFYRFTHEEPSKRVRSNIDKMIKEAGIADSQTKEEQIRKLENHIKGSVFITEDGGDQLSDLEFILANNVASPGGIVKLFIQSLKKIDVKYEIVLTTDRSNLAFDKEFESIGFLNEYLFYFPDTNQFLSPDDVNSRYGFPPMFLTENYGLFIKEVSVGDFKSGVGKVKYIASVPAEGSKDTMRFEVTFNEDDLTQNIISVDHAISGYNAAFIQPFLNLIAQEDKDDFYEEFIKRMSENITINKSEVLNEDPELFGIKPLRVKADVTSEQFTEKAGRKYLFKVGELIGLQTEMYQEKARALPVDNMFRRKYERTIQITIPKEYEVVNLDDLNINNSHNVDGESMMNFHSSYILEGNVLTITADELYDMTVVPLEHYETYRTIINSAADFNKITLILAPKS